MQLGRANYGAGVIDSHLVIAGGTYWILNAKRWTDRVDIYNVRLASWRSGPPLPVALGYGAASEVAPGRGISVFGGYDGVAMHREIWCLPSLTDTWHNVGELPVSRALASAATILGQTVILGGLDDVRDLRRGSDEVWIGTAGGKWRRSRPLPAGTRCLMASAVIGDTLFLFGGMRVRNDGQWTNLADSYRWDAAGDKWYPIAPLPHAARGLTATGTPDGSAIYLFGGNTSTSSRNVNQYLSDVWVYDIHSDTYRAETPLPYPLMLTDFFFLGNALVGAGGESMTGTISYGRSHRLLIGSRGIV